MLYIGNLTVLRSLAHAMSVVMVKGVRKIHALISGFYYDGS